MSAEPTTPAGKQLLASLPSEQVRDRWRPIIVAIEDEARAQGAMTEPPGAGADFWGRPNAGEHPEAWTE